jgi:two-component system sensor histidine kinase BaeS
VAFSAVAAVAVVLLTIAALIGTDRGIGVAQDAERRLAAQRAASAVAQAYQKAGGWGRADLAPAQAIVEAAGAHLVVRDADMTMMWPGHAPGNAGPGMTSRSNADSHSAPIVVDGRQVGTALLLFSHSISPETGRSVAWIWVTVAAAGALAIALAVSNFVARRLTRPLLAVTGAARAFARGDRKARSPAGGLGEIGELAAAFNTMADEVVRTEQIRRRLAADVAHELRTPLAALRAGLEELRDGLVDPRPARLGALHDQALRLSRVVDDLSQLSAAEAAALTLRLAQTDLAGIAAAALASQEPVLRAAGLTVESSYDHLVPVQADADRMHQAVVNLLANAARYCRPGDTVTVRVFESGDAAIVQVADTGPGIDAADLPHVFQRLWRGTTGTTVTGSGIGLAVVRELVTAHGGTVDVKSAAGGGATFTIQLPLAAPKPVTSFGR